MANGRNLPGVDPVAKRVWRNTQILCSLRNPEVIRQFFHFGAPRFTHPRFPKNAQTLPTLPRIVNLASLDRGREGYSGVQKCGFHAIVSAIWTSIAELEISGRSRRTMSRDNDSKRIACRTTIRGSLAGSSQFGVDWATPFKCVNMFNAGAVASSVSYVGYSSIQPPVFLLIPQRQRFPVACNLGSGKPLGTAELGVQSVVSDQ